MARRDKYPPISACWAPASPASRRRWKPPGSAARSHWWTDFPRSAGRRSTRSSVLSAACSPTALTDISLTDGIADDILRDLGAQGALHYRRGGGPSNTTVVMYDEVALSRWIEEAIRQAGITVLRSAPSCAAWRVTAAGCARSSLPPATATSLYSAAGFVDATGDAALTWQAGFSCASMPAARIYGTQ